MGMLSMALVICCCCSCCLLVMEYLERSLAVVTRKLAYGFVSKLGHEVRSHSCLAVQARSTQMHDSSNNSPIRLTTGTRSRHTFFACQHLSRSRQVQL